MGISLGGDLFQPGARPLERHFEACFSERFEQVIHGVEFKGPNGVLIVSGREDDDWNCSWRKGLALPKGFEHLKAVKPRHLHIEKEQVRVAFLRLLERLRAVGALGNDFHVRLILEKRTDPFARERFVVGNDGADFLQTSKEPVASEDLCGCQGISTRTITPPVGRDVSSSF